MRIAPDYVLGVSAFCRDSAAALLKDGHVVAAAQEERFSRIKHDGGFPARAIRSVLQQEGIGLSQVSAIAFYEKPEAKLERMEKMRRLFAPAFGLSETLPADQLERQVHMRAALEASLAALSPSRADALAPLYFSGHHLSHAASAYYPSPFSDAAALVIDGEGEWESCSISHGRDKRLTRVKEIDYPHSLGLLYSAFASYCGFRPNSGEYKLMGLAPYGDEDSTQTKEFERKIRDELIDLRADGSFVLNMDYFRFVIGPEQFDAEKWRSLFGIKPRIPETEDIERSYMNMALAIQRVTEDAALGLAREARRLTQSPNLCLAGEVALNCVVNGKILRSGVFDRIWIQPASNDAGGALGAALAFWHVERGKERGPAQDMMQGARLGPAFSDAEIMNVCREFQAPFQTMPDLQALCDRVADLLAAGAVVGWFQGRMEYGPRALGGRSILGDPRNLEMHKRLNLKIKFREGFRPFAPAVQEEECAACFDLEQKSPYMLLTAPILERLRAPPVEKTGDWRDMLYVRRSSLPAVTHIDYSARIQTVAKDEDPAFWNLLQSFKTRHGCAVLINTSFNVRGEPIVYSPADAYRCFMRTEMDYLAIGNLLLSKPDQPPLKEESWTGGRVLD